jgi:hypothetical protein
MRFTEHEMTAALTGAAKTVLATQRRDVRRGRVDVDTAWNELDGLRRFKLLDELGAQLLPVLVALPDVEVAAGTRPSYTDREVGEAVASVLVDAGSKLRRAVLVKARTALVQTALAHVPPRQDPDALVVPDHL